MNRNPLCPVDHYDGHDREAADGLTLCRSCLAHLRADLLKAPRVHRDLENSLTAAEGSDGQPHGSNPFPSLNLNTIVVQVRSDLEAQLRSWSRVVAEDRGHKAPTPDVESCAGFLTRNVEWLAAQPFAAEVATEISATVRHGMALIQPARKRRVPVGGCPDCSGKLTAELRDTDSILPALVLCDSDAEHVWTADEWRDLARRVARKAVTA